MRINKVREIMAKRQEEVDAALQPYRDRGLTNEEIVLENPFLMGQAVMLGMIALDWLIADVDI